MRSFQFNGNRRHLETGPAFSTVFRKLNRRLLMRFLLRRPASFSGQTLVPLLTTISSCFLLDDLSPRGA
jgi:hypothetical protein